MVLEVSVAVYKDAAAYAAGKAAVMHRLHSFTVTGAELTSDSVSDLVHDKLLTVAAYSGASVVA